MRFDNFINESTSGSEAWVKYFKDRDVNTRTKEDATIWYNGKKTDDIINYNEEIIVPSSSSYQKGKIVVIYNGKPVTIQFSQITKPTTKGGENLNIQTHNLIKTAPVYNSTINGITFKSAIFENSKDLSITIINSLQLIKTVPDDLKQILIDYLSSGKYSYLDWQGYDHKNNMKEVAKYLGELIIGLCVLNKERNVLDKDIFNNTKPKSFIVPSSPSFRAIDSMFSIKEGYYIPISSKSGKGASSSIHHNIIKTIINNNLPVRSKLLKFMVDSQKKMNFTAIEWVYYIGMNYLMAKQLQNTSLGRNIMKTSRNIYDNTKKGNITEKELLVFDIVKNGEWPVMNNMDMIVKRLPNSLTYFICQNIAKLLNKDKIAQEDCLNALSSKQFWQARLNQSKFFKNNVYFTMSSAGLTRIRFSGGKGTMGTVTTENGRLTYSID